MTAPKELAIRSRTLLDHARFTTLATTDGVTAWASTVNYVPLRAPLRLLWYSLHTARHSRNIATHPEVSGSVFMTGLPGIGIGLDGAQFTGICRAVAEPEAAECHHLYYELNFPNKADRSAWLLPLEQFIGDGPRRFYMLNLTAWWLLDIDRWLMDKHDQRISVPLDDW